MAQIVSLAEHRHRREATKDKVFQPGLCPPHISDRDLWSRDYRETEHIVFAVLKIKEILDYHLYYDDIWPYLLLSFLEAVHKLKEEGQKDLTSSGTSLKDYILSALTAGNKRDLSAALLLIDLVEKSPTYRGTMPP